MKNIRCAIYTRKSSEEGLEQSFNSLDAQREACAAYILSQASEGWSATGETYDDGGISGGTLERPGLQRLLADVAEGRIDIIVVYKVDRLTRSLLDFSRLVEAFDKADVSFVSVTQSFNTTTSMGRLTLNMLLSFAQFEREVTAERIRDKIAASKAKGMWMGGIPPLGYRPDGRSLAIVENHAELVRTIFRRYLDLGNVRLLAQALAREGIGAPLRTTTSGRMIGGRPFSRGQLYLMLKCRTFLGEVQHREAIYPGLHPPIIDRDLWDQVQARLAANLQGQRSGTNSTQPALLSGLVTDEDGEPLLSVHATKSAQGKAEGGKTRYRYYISKALQAGNGADAGTRGMRIPAREIETLVTQRLGRAFDDPLTLVDTAGLALDVHNLHEIELRAAETALALRRRDRTVTRRLITTITVTKGKVTISCRTAAIASALGIERERDVDTLALVCEVRLTRSGRAVRLVHDKSPVQASQVDPSLVRLLVQAHRYWQILRSEPIDMKTLAVREKVSASWVTRVLRLAFLSPAVTEAILSGRHRGELDGAALIATDAIDPSWQAQAGRFLPSG